MLSCKKATELIERKKFIRLGRIESLQLTIHKSMCDFCTKYEIQSNIIDDILKENYDTFHHQHHIGTSDDVKKSILEKLN